MLNDEMKAILRDKFTSKFKIEQQDLVLINDNAYLKSFKKGEIFYAGQDCYGYIIIVSGVLRAFVASVGTKEITIFRLREGESCILCDTCAIKAMQSPISVQIERDARLIVIPARLYKRLKQNYPAILDHTLSIVSDRFSKAIKVMEQALFLPLSERIINFLKQNSDTSHITHEELANHLGSAREAVSRVLKEMRRSGLISQSRGVIKLNS